MLIYQIEQKNCNCSSISFFITQLVAFVSNDFALASILSSKEANRHCIL